MDSLSEIRVHPTTCTKTDKFLKATSILVEKPHVINRILCGATVLLREKAFKNTCSMTEIFQKLVHWRGVNFVEWCSGAIIDCSFCENLCDAFLQNYIDVCDDTNSTSCTDAMDWKMTIRLVLPKNPQKFRKLLELIVSSGKSVLFFPLMTVSEDKTEVSEGQAFCLSHEVSEDEESNSREASLALYGEKSKTHPHHSEKWLSSVLLPKLVKWAEEDDLHTGASSLRLVSLERYNQVYHEMKEKYGKKLVEIWPEKTDPLKFVYEEVAIASYLLVFFEEERRLKNLDHRQSFVDLGCGNGLLVYVLANEGHPGKGIDVRRRTIWDMFGPEIILEETSITPSDETLFKDTDWLIGNHSDELTPWIPVMAARSSYSCSYFVLPCCAHDFNGKFFERRPGCSQYQAYLNYIMEVGTKCGFSVQQDMLRIPSTKRTCFIGCKRTYSATEEKEMDKERTAFIKERCERGNRQRGNTSESNSMNSRMDWCVECDSSAASSDHIHCDCQIDLCSVPKLTDSVDVCQSCDKSCAEVRKRKCSGALVSYSSGRSDKEKCVEGAVTSGDCSENVTTSADKMNRTSWAQNFKPREQAEKVRNCTGVSRDLQDRIVREVFKAVLEAKDGTNIVTTDRRNWKRGGSIPLGDVAKMFDKPSLSQLKNECGGLQTLLRNKHQIFMVVGGKVYLRYEDGTTPVRKEKKIKKDTSDFTKTKLCWFFSHHPDGCPWETKDCSFAHGNDDLQTTIKD